MSSTIIQTESLQEFYKRTNQEIPYDLLQERSGPGHFNVKLSHTIARKTPYNRRDYFKICLSNGGSGIFRYNGQEIMLDRPCLIFSNPSIPTSIEIPTGSTNRYYCLFNNRFIEGHISPDIQYACALFNPSLPPVIWLTPEEKEKLHLYFVEQQLLLESDYPFKWDMIRNLLLLLIHEGIRLQQAGLSQLLPGSDRIVKNFFTLLNQQFPVHSPENPLKHLSPSHFAALLHVHINHLNSVMKKQTGKTTRAIIQERVIHEAKAMLQNTDWNIAEIAYALGFEYPSHFNKNFKQFALVTPMEFRAAIKPVFPRYL
ncbi:MAG TPA: helix-turn-helix transcriptional regulator [Flavitalea sp.]|nr:helix-turn-helix transcriptional regulator [Flavitalea sp.]